MSRGPAHRLPELGVVIALVGAALLSPGSASAAVINVTSAADTGGAGCELREAIEAANTNAPFNDCPTGEGPGLDTIVLQATTYTLTGAAADESNASGDLDVEADAAVEGPLTITGQGQGATTINTSAMQDRIVHLEDGTLKVEELTVTGGDAGALFGGGIFANGNPESSHLTVEDAAVTGNTALGGGGIAVSQGITSSLTLTRATVTGNTANGASNDGGGVAAAAEGGGQITITDSTISGNMVTGAQANAHGGGLNLFGPASITGSVISNNTIGDGMAPADGGNGAGIAYLTGGTDTLAISDTTISGNTTERIGGGIYADGTGPVPDPTVDIDQSMISMNTAGSGGGGILVDDATLELDLSALSGNSVDGDASAAGGGIGMSGTDVGASTATIADSVIADNTGETTSAVDTNFGGGISNAGGTLTARRSTISGNGLVGGMSQFGGGYAQSGSSASSVLINTTISGNTAPLVGAKGGGIHRFVSGGDVKLINSTVSGNVADAADAMSGDGFAADGGTGVFSFGNTIIDQPADDCSPGTYTTLGNNISSHPTPSGCDLLVATMNDLDNTDPALGPLGDNGGTEAGRPGSTVALETHAIDPPSAAIDHVPTAPTDECVDDNPGAGTGLAVDQDERGIARPFNTDCDAGAFEYSDIDGDGAEAGGDNCPNDANGGQEDNDADGAGDVCDLDDDNDGVPDADPDNCQFVANPGQEDNDADALGDACDPDDDNDGVADGVDNCQFVANADQANNDGDGLGNACDPTPFPPPSSGGAGASTAAAPSNQFDLGKLQQNKKKGIAFLIVNVPGPGELGLQGKGVQPIGLATTAARKSRAVAGGVVKLKIKPGKGKAARKVVRQLKDKGKAKLKVLVTYLPTGGVASTQSRRVKLIRK